MIKCKVKSNDDSVRGKVKITGNTANLAIETAVLVSSVYEDMVERSPDVAKAYRKVLYRLLFDPESPVFIGDKEE